MKKFPSFDDICKVIDKLHEKSDKAEELIKGKRTELAQLSKMRAEYASKIAEIDKKINGLNNEIQELERLIRPY